MKYTIYKHGTKNCKFNWNYSNLAQNIESKEKRKKK